MCRAGRLPGQQRNNQTQEQLWNGTGLRRAPVITSARGGEAPGEVVLEWEAEADFESGIRQFVIYRNGKRLALFPENPKDPTGFAQFQTLSYHDTPAPGAPAMRFIDRSVPANQKLEYAISIINGAGIEGKKSKQVTVK